MLFVVLQYDNYYAEALYQAPLSNVSRLLRIFRNETHFVVAESDEFVTIYTLQNVFRVHYRFDERVCDVAEVADGVIPNILPDISRFVLRVPVIRKRGILCSFYQRQNGCVGFQADLHQECLRNEDFYCLNANDSCIPIQYDVRGHSPIGFEVPHGGVHSYYFYKFDNASGHEFDFPEMCSDAQKTQPLRPVQDQPAAVKALEKRHITEQLDYRVRAVLSPVADQLDCNASYAFALAGMIEARLNLKLKLQEQRRVVSAQELLSCLFTDLQQENNNGCAGGNAHAAVKKFIFDLNGRVPAALTSYSGRESECLWSKWPPKTRFSSFYRVGSGISAIKNELRDNGPAIADMWVSLAYFDYSGGVFNDPQCGSESADLTRQTVLIVGYGHDLVSGDYWIIKDSLGSMWGMDGYMYISMTADCGLSREVYAVVSGVNGGAIAGLVILFVMLLSVAGLVIWFCLCRQNRGDDERQRLLHEDITSNSYQ